MKGEPGMKGERGLLRLGEWLVTWASRCLPARVREERRREWLGELPVILRDPGTRHGWQRAARMLGYAADTLRAAAVGPRPAPHHGTHRAGNPNAEALKVVGMLLFLLILPVAVGFVIWLAVVDTRFAPLWGLSCGWAIPALITYRSTRRSGFPIWAVAALAVSSAVHLALIAAHGYGWLAAHSVLSSVLGDGVDTLVCVCWGVVALMWVRAAILRRRAAPK